MIINETLLYPAYEIIGGEKIMAPSAPLGHSGILFRLAVILGNYVMEKKSGYVFPDDVDVHLPDGSLFKPDLVVITAENVGIMNWHDAIHGVPDMVVEVLSRSTQKRDLTIKKNSYEFNGVKEYWIVDPYMEIIDVYILNDGKYFLDGEYINYTDEEFEALPEDEKAEVKFEISPSIFPDLKIRLKDIFAWGFSNAFKK